MHRVYMCMKNDNKFCMWKIVLIYYYSILNCVYDRILVNHYRTIEVISINRVYG